MDVCKLTLILFFTGSRLLLWAQKEVSHEKFHFSCEFSNWLQYHIIFYCNSLQFIRNFLYCNLYVIHIAVSILLWCNFIKALVILQGFLPMSLQLSGTWKHKKNHKVYANLTWMRGVCVNVRLIWQADL